MARSNEGGSGFLALLVIACSAWWGYSYVYAPTHKAEPSSIPQDLQNQLFIAVAVAMPQTVPRLELLQGGNLDIYVTKGDFQSVPYPDRSDVLKKVGTTRCSIIEHTFVSAMRFKDIKTGASLGGYGCVSGSTWLTAEP